MTAADLTHIAQPATDAAKKYSDFATWVFPVPLALAALKLWIVVFIFRSTRAAIYGEWNDHAVDFRYISERLRALNYLPLIGSFQPPAAAPAKYASRVVHMSAVDWLFDAIIRSVSPAQLAKYIENLCPTTEEIFLTLDDSGDGGRLFKMEGLKPRTFTPPSLSLTSPKKPRRFNRPLKRP